MAIPLLAGALIAAGSSLLSWVISRVIALLGIGFITVVGVKLIPRVIIQGQTRYKSDFENRQI